MKKHIFLALSATLAMANEVVFSDFYVKEELKTMDFQEGKNSIKKEFLKLFSGDSQGLSSVIKLNPAVTYGKSNTTNFNAASIKPDEISIHGQLSYENNFSLDNQSITNLIEPAEGSIVHPTKGESSPTQGVFLNPLILESVDVLDSFISAKYGNFSGGVIDAKSKQLSNGGGYFSLGFTSSNLSKQLFDDCLAYKDKNTCKNYAKIYEENSTLNPDFNKIYKKYTSTFGLNHSIDEKWFFGFDFAEQKNEIYKFANANSHDNSRYKNKNISDNFLAKFSYVADNGVIFTPSILYAPSKQEYKNDISKGESGRFEIRQKNIASKMQFEYEKDELSLDSRLFFTRLNYDRKTATNVMKQYRASSVVDWGNDFYAYDGFLRGIKKQNDEFGITADASMEFTKHKIDFGLAYSHSITRYGSEKSEYYLMPQSFDDETLCKDDLCILDDSFSSLGIPRYANSVGQFFSQKISYDGAIRLKNDYFSVYAEDEFWLKNAAIRLGLRGDYDRLYRNFNIAPRLKNSINFDSSKLVFGYARYYAKMPLIYKINEIYEPGTKYERKSPDEEFATLARFQMGVNPIKNKIYGKLKTPYDDEFALSYLYDFDFLKSQIKYVFRNGKNQVMSRDAKTLGLDDDYKYYVNDGKSKNHNFSLTITGDFELFDIENNWALIADYNIFKRNLDSYASDNLSVLEMLASRVQKDGRRFLKDKIYYDGEVIDAQNKPYKNFHQPLGIRLASTHKYGDFTLSSIVRFESGIWYEKIGEKIIDESSKMRSYTLKHQKSTVMSDFFLRYDFGLKSEKREYKNYVSMNISNAFNTKRVQSNDGILRAGRTLYFELGSKF